ncbi:hypothetical protein BASA60_003750 [Batrachochytrium salamandrivorans]|nr:hypothetical protein BASA60_003750 [Batrachochytrium salamandrivorans]
MKFNAFVVAAMAIASVNAGGNEKSPGCFGRRCGKSKSPVKHAPLKNKPGPISSQESMDDDFATPAFDLSGYDLESMFPDGLPKKRWNVTINPDPKKDPICDPILEELSIIRIDGQGLNNALQKWFSTVYDIITEESDDEEGVKGKGHKKGDSKAEKIQEWTKSNSKAILPLKNIQAKSAKLQDLYDETWQKLVSSKCPTEKLQHWTPSICNERWMLS